MKKATQNTGRPRTAYAFAVWAAIMAAGFALAAGQTGCAKTVGGLLYGVSRDYDAFMDSGHEGSQERKSNRRD